LIAVSSVSSDFTWRREITCLIRLQVLVLLALVIQLTATEHCALGVVIHVEENLILNYLSTDVLGRVVGLEGFRGVAVLLENEWMLGILANFWMLEALMALM
jgi:hypothetical protein